MQVIGSLVRLQDNNRTLAVPWYCRATLGLLSNTPVSVALVGTHSSADLSPRPPDIVVSVLNTSFWNAIRSVTSLQEDRPGVLSSVLRDHTNSNIALAETVTVIANDGLGGYVRMHDVAIVTEPSRIPNVAANPSTEPLRPDNSMPLSQLGVVLDHQATTVNDGWLPMPFDWRAEIRKCRVTSLASFSLNHAVVSADLKSRVLRFVFPRRGARELRIRHIDQPGVLAALASVFEQAQVNILASYLRRGGTGSRQAEWVVTCEPTPAFESMFLAKSGNSQEAVPEDAMEDVLSQAIGQLVKSDAQLTSVFAPKISRGRDLGTLRETPSLRSTIVAEELLPREYIDSVGSHHANNDVAGGIYVRTGSIDQRFVDRYVRLSLRTTTGRPILDGDAGDWRSRRVLMGCAKYAVIAVSSEGDALEDVVRSNKAIDCGTIFDIGFLAARGVSTLLLTDDAARFIHFHADGNPRLMCHRFSQATMDDPTVPSSIPGIINSWLQATRLMT